MNAFSLNEFKPTIRFLLKFVGLYLILNFVYGMIITSYYPRTDPATHLVSQHCSAILNGLGSEVVLKDSENKPTTVLMLENRNILSVYEGCNGINTVIIFISFLVAFGPIKKSLWIFILIGIVVIHLTNIARIIFLFYVVENRPQYLYFTHKYLFTAILYMVIFIMWFFWVFSLRRSGIKVDTNETE